MRGYDIDGVLIPGKVVPQAPYVVISGRLHSEFQVTVDALGAFHPVYLRPYGEYGDTLLAARWKAEMIQRLGVTEFWEDDMQQIGIMTILLSAYGHGCKINHVT